MKPLAIYFNEKSLCGTLTQPDWSQGVEALFDVLNGFLAERPDGDIVFTHDSWNSTCGDRPLAAQFEKMKSGNRTRYQKFRLKVRRISRDAQLDQEVFWRDETAEGLTLAAVHDSWCFSIAAAHADWAMHQIQARCDVMDESGNLSSTACTVKNLANQAHLAAWKTLIQDWGLTVAASSVLDSLKGHDVVMYSFPREHNPPHVHVLHKGSGETLAKYRIEDGMREDGKPTLDAEMRVWLACYKDQLLRSWKRCERGGHPYQLNKNA